MGYSLSVCVLVVVAVAVVSAQTSQRGPSQQTGYIPRGPRGPNRGQYPYLPTPTYRPPYPQYPTQRPYYPQGPYYPPGPQFPVFPFPVTFPTAGPTTAPTTAPTPAPTCDVCQRLDLLTALDANLALIDQTIPIPPTCPTAPPSGLTVLVGPAATFGGAAQVMSQTICPVGSIVVSCRCSGEQPNCNGVRIISSRICRAFKNANTATTEPIRALAVCSQNSGGQFVIPAPVVPAATNPVATCPLNHRIAECFLFNGNPGAAIINAVIDAGPRQCSVSAACAAGAAGCLLAVLCEQLPAANPSFRSG